MLSTQARSTGERFLQEEPGEDCGLGGERIQPGGKVRRDTFLASFVSHRSPSGWNRNTVVPARSAVGFREAHHEPGGCGYSSERNVRPLFVNGLDGVRQQQRGKHDRRAADELGRRNRSGRLIRSVSTIAATPIQLLLLSTTPRAQRIAMPITSRGLPPFSRRQVSAGPEHSRETGEIAIEKRSKQNRLRTKREQGRRKQRDGAGRGRVLHIERPRELAAPQAPQR